MKWAIVCVAAMWLSVGCKGSGHGHGHGDEGSEHGGHAHAEELPGESVTVWTDKAELFMEWEPLIVGHASTFLAHISDLRDPAQFKPVVDGDVVVTVTVGGKPITARAQEPTQPGIFVPALTPDTAGPCTLSVALKGPSVSETFTALPCTIYPDLEAARAVVDDAEPPAQIAFLKEQQWPIAFATRVVRKESIVPSKTVNAKIAVVPGREARLTAATSGRVSLPSPLPTLGSAVAKGQVLARIQPTASAPGNIGTLRADVAVARAENAAAKAAHERLERLVASDSIPRRRLEEAASDIEVTKARLEAASARLSAYNASAAGSAKAGSGAFQVSSPISGTLVEQSVTEGETISAGDALFTVVDLDRVWVEGRIFEPDVPAFENSHTGWFTVDGRSTVFEIDETSGKLITVGHVLDPVSRTVPVVFEVENPNRVLRIGQFARLSVATGPPASALVIPEAAVLQDGNQDIAFVHVSGESFERRVVTLGAHSRGLVEVLQGLTEGERVVSQGAYDVKLAASAGNAPAHGHAH